MNRTALILCLFLSSWVWADYEVTLPAHQDPVPLEIDYWLTGPFGGQGGRVNGETGHDRYRIPTTVKGQKAEGLKAVVFSPGCEFATINVPSIEASSRKAEFDCAKVPFLSLAGRLPKKDRGNPVEVTLNLNASWICAFYGLGDCMIPVFTVAKTTSDVEGRFQVDLPDYSQNHGGGGSLSVLIRSKTIRLLRPVNVTSEDGNLPIAPHYPQRILFEERRD
jgi:hypothetical protein